MGRLALGIGIHTPVETEYVDEIFTVFRTLSVSDDGLTLYDVEIGDGVAVEPALSPRLVRSRSDDAYLPVPAGVIARENARTITNMVDNFAAPTTNTFTVINGNKYVLQSTGTYNYTLSGAFVGTLVGTSQHKRLAFTASTTSLTITVNVAGALWQLEDTTGRLDDTLPGEFVTTSGGPASQAFPTSNGNIVDGSDVVTPSVGTPLDRSFPSVQNVTAENLCLHSWDITDVTWEKINCTAALNVRGVNGVANTGATITASGANATCLYTYTTVIADHACLLRLKRGTGSGVVEVTIDDGVSWIAVLFLAGGWTEIATNKNVENPSFGIRITESGDSVILGEGILIAGSSAAGLPSIPTDGSTESVIEGGKISFNVSNHKELSNKAAAYLFEFTSCGGLDVVQNILSCNALTQNIAYTNASAQLASSDGTNTAAGGSLVTGTLHFGAIEWSESENKLRTFVDGVWSADQPFDGSFDPGAALTIFLDATGNHSMSNLRLVVGAVI